MPCAEPVETECCLWSDGGPPDGGKMLAGAEPDEWRLTAGAGGGGRRPVGTGRLFVMVTATLESLLGCGSAQPYRQGAIRRLRDKVHVQSD